MPREEAGDAQQAPVDIEREQALGSPDSDDVDIAQIFAGDDEED